MDRKARPGTWPGSNSTLRSEVSPQDKPKESKLADVVESAKLGDFLAIDVNLGHGVSSYGLLWLRAAVPF